MTTTAPTAHVATKKQRDQTPPLNAGDFLSRAAFERRYAAHPEIKKAELIEGVVYMPSPIRFSQHGEPHAWIIAWLGTYVAATPGIRIGDNTTVRLDLENEVQPDALLRLEDGSSTVGEEGYIEDAPELIVEIAASSAAYDRHVKQRVYARSGVQEYVVIQMYEREIVWFVLRENGYEALAPDENGRLRSQLLPGLWLDTAAFWDGDLAQLLATCQAGIASTQHAEFVNRLQTERQ